MLIHVHCTDYTLRWSGYVRLTKGVMWCLMINSCRKVHFLDLLRCCLSFFDISSMTSAKCCNGDSTVSPKTKTYGRVCISTRGHAQATYSLSSGSAASIYYTGTNQPAIDRKRLYECFDTMVPTRGGAYSSLARGINVEALMAKFCALVFLEYQELARATRG